MKSTGLRFCGFVEPIVVVTLLTILLVQSILIGYLLIAKKVERYEEHVDAETPDER